MRGMPRRMKGTHKIDNSSEEPRLVQDDLSDLYEPGISFQDETLGLDMDGPLERWTYTKKPK